MSPLHRGGPTTERDGVGCLGHVTRMHESRRRGACVQLLRAISAHFGRDIWQRTLLCLTRGGITPPPPLELQQLAERRAQQLNGFLRKAGAPGGMPYTLVENSTRCGGRPI